MASYGPARYPEIARALLSAETLEPPCGVGLMTEWLSDTDTTLTSGMMDSSTAPSGPVGSIELKELVDADVYVLVDCWR